MKELKDYLHLYYMVDCHPINGRFEPVTIHSIINPGNRDVALRPLSDITNREGIKLAGIVGGHGDWFLFKRTKDILTLTTSEKGGWHVDIHFDNAVGVIFEVSLLGESSKCDGQAQAFHYLLSRGFDLFGLIESGLAIDKTTLK